MIFHRKKPARPVLTVEEPEHIETRLPPLYSYISVEFSVTGADFDMIHERIESRLHTFSSEQIERADARITHIEAVDTQPSSGWKAYVKATLTMKRKDA